MHEVLEVLEVHEVHEVHEVLEVHEGCWCQRLSEVIGDHERSIK